MSFWGVVFGTVGQMVLAMFLFMLAAFAGAGKVSGRSKSLSERHKLFLDLSIYALPASTIVSASIVIFCYNNGGSSLVYWWYAMPIFLAVVYVILVTKT